MKINADLDRFADARGDELPWLASPLKGVERKMLERNGAEVARATTIVRYAPGSMFSAHTHSGGEEFLVLDGVFSDEHGDFPAGTYVRNPVGSHHRPFSADGCTILVKLWQMPADDQLQLRLDTNAADGWVPLYNNVSVLPLHRTEHEYVRLLKFGAGMPELALSYTGGLEIFVVRGGVWSSAGHHARHGWLRWPGDGLVRFSADNGSRLLVKSGHLAAPPPLPHSEGQDMADAR